MWDVEREQCPGFDEQNIVLMRHIMEKLSYAMVFADFSMFKGRSRLEFDIPHDLKASWQLDN